ncbi:hypothetical protein CkaCkLH20_09948 [Colletotrichum karsti]|uniref:MOSC domain-containing protein n=1 Tax=Colletotrichum karsti TaxID=1095194 RepID=A0A9P6I1S1_9PEZI|nr:uncharacterized protein CkaCkLH20_09948 [Colletotrichum karsti]KAF9872451.1 hypothetical protein CkaCkLH20_09948 [Colletotrichum karsti]
MLPVEVDYAQVTRAGFRFDRQYVLVERPTDTGARFAQHLSVKRIFSLVLFQPSIDDGWSKLTIRHTLAHPESSVTVPLTPSPLFCASADTLQVSIFGTFATGIDMGDEPADFFSKHLNMQVRLLFIGGCGYRALPGIAYGYHPVGGLPVDSPLLDKAVYSNRIRFADAAPYLVTSTASEEEARSRLPLQNRNEDVIIRFRPNIHIDVGDSIPPFDEDDWKRINVYDEPNQGKHKAVISYKPVFGQYAYITPIGVIVRVGDSVELTDGPTTL